MEKVAHGIYILDDVWPDELFVLQQRNKNIIYSGETALYLHGLIDREYSHICFTVPTGYNPYMLVEVKDNITSNTSFNIPSLSLHLFHTFS